MNQQVYLTNMFPDYEPPEELRKALSQAAIVAADIFPETGTVEAAVHAESYIPQRLLDQAAREIASLYGLRKLSLTATHPETELHKIEPEELMQLFVSRNSMPYVRRQAIRKSPLPVHLSLEGFPVLPYSESLAQK